MMTLDELFALKSSKKKHKYNAKPCTSQEGIKFPSLLERSYYQRLIQAQNENKIDFFLRQVPFHLPGNVKYVVDFLVCYPNDDIEFIDVKGKMTPMSNLKIKQVESLYPIKIKIVDNEYMKKNVL